MEQDDLDEYGIPKKKGASAAPAQATDEFGIPIKKKTLGASSTSGVPSSSNGLNSSPGFRLVTNFTPLAKVDYSQYIQDKNANHASPNTEPIPVKPSVPKGSNPRLLTNEEDKAVFGTKTQLQRSGMTADARHKNSWDNLDLLPDVVLGGLEKDLGDAAKFVGDKVFSNPTDVLAKQYLSSVALKLEGYGKDKEQKADEAALPNTAAGNTVTGVTKLLPTIAELYLTPEAEVSKLGKLGELLTKYGGKYAPKVANAAAGKFPLLMGANGLTNGYAQAKDDGMSDYEATKAGLINSAKEYGKGILFEGAGAAAGKVGKIGSKALEDAGLMSEGKLVSGAQKAILHSTAQAAAFSTIPVITNAMEGKPTNLDEFKNNAIFGGLLGLFHGERGDKDEPTAADGAAGEVHERSPAIDMQNFVNADMDAVKYAHGLDANPDDLHLKAATHAQNAFKESDPVSKQQEISLAAYHGKLASVKAVTSAILKDKNAVIDALPDDVDKQPIIDKINQVYKELDPIEQQKTAMGDKLNELSDAIDKNAARTPDNPVDMADKKVIGDRLQKEHDTISKELEKTIANQYEEQSKPVEEGKPAEELPAETPKADAAPAEEKTPAPVDEKSGDNLTPKEHDTASIEKETDPKAVAARYHSEESGADYKEQGIIDYLGNGKINEKDYKRWGDANGLGDHTDPKKLRWVDGTNSSKTDLAKDAEILSEQLGVPVTPEDFIEVIDKYKGRERFNEENKTDTQRLLEQRYEELTGNKLTPKKAESAWHEAHNITKLDLKQKQNFNQVAKSYDLTEEDYDKYYEHLAEQQSGNNGRNAEPASDKVSEFENEQTVGKNDNEKSTGAQKRQSLTDAEAARKLELRKKFSGRFNDITNIPAMLSDKEFREYAGLVFKEAAGDFKAFSADLIDSVGEKIKEHLPGLFKDLGGKLPEEEATTDKSSVVQLKADKEPIGIRNADVSEERGKAVDRTHKSREQTDAEGKRLVDRGELNPDEFAQKIIDNPYPASTEEQAALRYHKVNLEKEQRQLSKEPNTENQAKYALNEDRLEKNRKATEIIGNENARALGDRQGAMAEDYSRVHILERAKMANGGELDPKDERELTERTARIKDLEDKLAEREEQIRKLHDQGTVDKVKRTAEREERYAKRQVTKASLRKEREGLVAELHLIARKSMSSAGANKIPVEMLPTLAKLARNYVLDGAVTISAVADKIYNDLKDHLDGLEKDDIEKVIKDNFDGYLAEQNKVRLERSKALQQKKLENLQSGNYEKKVYSKIQVDNDYLAIRAKINREQMLINKKIEDIQNSKKSVGRKVVDFAVKYGRQAKLASVTVIGKLAAAGLSTATLKPLTEGVGKGMSAIFKKIADKSIVEGSVSREAMKEAAATTGSVDGFTKAFARAATQGMKDAYDELNIKQGGQSDLSALYKDKKGHLPPEVAEFFGHIHSAIKAPIKRFTWEHSYAKRVAKGIQAGLDVTDPVIDARNRLEAYKDAERAIFLGDNWLSSQYEHVTGSAEKSQLASVRNVGAIARILFPFVKVPTNIVLETARYAFGLIPGISRVAQVGASDLANRAGAQKLASIIHSGLGELTPEESDVVLRNLKKGTVGGAAMALGFFNPKNVGGYYQDREKRKKNEPGPDAFKIGDTKIPMWMTEHPIFQAMQVGATFRRLLDKNLHKDDKYETATLGVISGISENIPLAEGAKQITEAIGGNKPFNKYVSSVIKGEVIPSALSQLATITDTKDGSSFTFNPDNQNKRKPNNKHGLARYLKEELETGVPGLRENVKK